MMGGSTRQWLAALERSIRQGLLGRSEGGTIVPFTLLAMLLSLPALATRSAGAVLYLVLRATLMLLAPGLFQRELIVVLIPLCVVAMSMVFRTTLGGRGPRIFALILALAVVPHAPGFRRQVASVRQAYRSNSELLALAQAAGALPTGTSIATTDPALVYLGSGHDTQAPAEFKGTAPTHIIVPRRDPLPDECIATRSLMLCPR
jgi:hypothetical protein